MDHSTAISVFNWLERQRFNDDGRWNADLEDPDAGWNPPTYDVRLDASTSRNDEREFRVRVTPGGSTGGIEPALWGEVLQLAAKYSLQVDIQNAGMELR